MNSSVLARGLESGSALSWPARLATWVVVVLCASVFTTVALTNVAVLLLVLLAPWAWWEHHRNRQSLEPAAIHFLGLALLFSAWDVFTNLYAGHGLGASLQMLLRDLRPLAFLPLFWVLFTRPRLARLALWTLLACVLALATVNLVLTLTGHVRQGQYFTKGLSLMSHMYGQALVGLVFVLAQICLIKPQWRWQAGVPMVLLILSLFLASERRTGWLLLAAGFVVWALLNARRLFVGRYRAWVVLALCAGLALALNSDIVQVRMAQAWKEFSHFLALSPQERSATVFGSVSVRMQYAATIWEVIAQSNWWIGVGSVDLAQAYQAAATRLGVSPESWATYNWRNPHNEYLFMWATKGLVGLTLYLAIFVQACRMAWRKRDEVQRVGLLIFVFLFMLSIVANSMVIDMQEGHFTMLVLLIFLAPKSLDVLGPAEGAPR
jgi:O-antigen ligase